MTNLPEEADAKRSDLRTYAITFERARPDAFDSLDRAEKYAFLRGSAERARKRLAEWIEAEGLEGEIVEVSDPTAFDLIFARSTPEGAERLRKAPGVVSVVEDPDIPLDLARVRLSPPDPP